ncbi:MAG: YidC/Oxa1 family rane protein insertase [Campylobacterota bacterium]|nr:YidC/Oxa1 family rane protein insertase [Campylobacterota bacterium]
MTPNQRLIVAILLSISFFAAYTAIFPPEQPETTKSIEQVQKQENSTLAKSDKPLDASVGHEVVPSQSISADATTLLKVSNAKFVLKMDTLGRIISKELLQDKYNDKDDKHAQLIPEAGPKPLFIRFADVSLNDEAAKTPYTVDISEVNLDEKPSQKVTLTQKLSLLTVTKEITFYADGHYDAAISLSEDKKYFVYLGQRPQITEQMMTVSGAMVYTDNELITIVEDGSADGRKTFSGVELISAFDQYSATIMYGFTKDTTIVIDRDTKSNPVAYFEATQNIKFGGYVGQKEYKTLHSINPVLTNAIEYGWFTFASKPLFQLLSWLYGIFGNWGWSIIALTLIIRVILYPLTHKGMMSMQKMKELSPHIKTLQAKYKGDPQRLNAAMMDMYKKHGANPLGGCLPMVLQIPVFFAIYRVLLNAVELQGAEWMLWVDDLSRMDSTLILPILMGASMYYQQRMTPSNFTDPIQEKVFKYLPVIFTFFFITFPAGLVLYWFVNNMFSIAQQFIVNQQFKNAKDSEIAAHKHAEKKND